MNQIGKLQGNRPSVKPAAPQENREVNISLNELKEIVQIVDDNLDKLRNRMAWACRDIIVPMEESSNEKKSAYGSGLAGEISGITYRLEEINREILHMEEALQL